jgi:catechol 2,3-dioxygenase-like lactoylglutathione lyase family enzyme
MVARRGRADEYDAEALEDDRMSSEFPPPDAELTRLLVVSDIERSQRWYVDVLGARLERAYGGTSVVLQVLGQWLLLVTGGGPTADKPTVTFEAPADPDRASAQLIFGVRDCREAYETLRGRGAAFLTPPVEYEWEIRAFFRDPDGHLFEISEPRR